MLRSTSQRYSDPTEKEAWLALKSAEQGHAPRKPDDHPTMLPVQLQRPIHLAARAPVSFPTQQAGASTLPHLPAQLQHQSAVRPAEQQLLLPPEYCIVSTELPQTKFEAERHISSRSDND
ncbi:hypothetical protein D1872_287680 [compost metagenome]